MLSDLKELEKSSNYLTGGRHVLQPLLHKTLSNASQAHLSFLNLFIYFCANYLAVWQTAA